MKRTTKLMRKMLKKICYSRISRKKKPINEKQWTDDTDWVELMSGLED